MGKTAIDLPQPTDITAQTARSLPALLKAYGSNVLPFETALLDASKVIEPQQIQHAIDLYTKYGPQANKIGADIAAANAKSMAQAELETLKGPGQELFTAGIELDKLLNPEYYKTRSVANDSLVGLINSVNPNALTPTEAAEIERQLARTGELPGSSSWRHAATFGSALNNKKDRLAQILSLAPSTLQASRSNVDPFLVATGRASFGMPNSGEARLPGYNPNLGNRTIGVGQSVLGTTADTMNNNSNINLQLANANSPWNRALQASQLFSNVVGSFGGKG